MHRLGAELVAISPELADRSLSLLEKHALTFPVLNDRGNVYARQCGLAYAMAEELRPIYKNWGVDLQEANGDDSFVLPLPATFVVNRQSQIILSFVDADYTKRLEPSAILEVLKEYS